MKLTFDSDMLSGSDKQSLLELILKSRKPVTVVHGPAGCGKTTFASKSTDGFVLTAADVAKASEFVVISGANKTKSGGMSPKFQQIVKRAKRVQLFVVQNQEIIRRRVNRVANGAIDNRTAKQLKASFRAPLNQFDLLAKIRKLNKNTEIVSS